MKKAFFDICGYIVAFVICYGALYAFGAVMGLVLTAFGVN